MVPGVPLEVLQELLRIIGNERMTAIRESVERSTAAEVVEASHGIITLEPEEPMSFQAGDPLGAVIWEGGGSLSVRYLGTILDASENLITVHSPTRLPIPEGEVINICDYEMLLGYDLQKNLIRQIMGLEEEDEKHQVRILNERAIELMLGPLHQLPPLKFEKLEDKMDVRREFTLDSSQIRAVEAALALEENQILLIVGPPGSGKTKTIAKIAYELARRGESVLISSHTNRAVDNAVEQLPLDRTLRVGRPEKILESTKKYLLSHRARERAGRELAELERRIKEILGKLKRLERELRGERSPARNVELRGSIASLKDELRTLHSKRAEIIRKHVSELVWGVPIIGSTLIKSQLQPLAERPFDTVIIDEASQASITLALLAMVKGKKWVIVGDHKQLLPIFRTVGKRMREELSAFVRLLKRFPERHLWLEWHYRSNHEIISFISENVYGGRIKPAETCKHNLLRLPRPPKIPALSPEKPVVFVHVDGIDLPSGTSRYNENEAKVATEIAKDLLKCGIKDESIGIIAPYRAQRSLIAKLLKNTKIEINTIDAFQGREKDIIIFSVTATSNLTFVTDPHRLSVAFSRPRLKLIVVGNGNSVLRTRDNLLKRFLIHCYKRNAIFNWESQKWISDHKSLPAT
ncbi:MAG: DEAD/DEAH box helicase [Candidatus Baldrarchaeia archaeon]